VLVEEKQRAEGLILSRGGDVQIRREVAEKRRDLRLAHLVGVAFAVEENEPPYPIDIGLLGAYGIALYSQMPTDAVQQARFCQRGLGSWGGHFRGSESITWREARRKQESATEE
jgi:hypothetical protein